MRSLVFAGLVLAACGGDDAGTGDVDASALPACTGGLYEACTSNDQCMSGICREFNMLGGSACTSTCTIGDDTTCPAHAEGAEVTCNRTQGQCRPTAIIACSR